MSATATRTDVVRLLGRAAFGATAADVDTWTGRPYAELVETLLEVPAVQVRTDDAERTALALTPGQLPAGVRVDPALGQLPRARRWWLRRMQTTPHPLLERMTLLWHDHLATAVMDGYPDTAMLVQQNETLRTHALGNVRELLYAITVDPAMLHWLDGAISAPPAPNENYARELFELFALGRDPQVYTERDIREAARALTGWTVDSVTRMASFRAGRHDTGTKRILGRVLLNQGDREHRAVVDVALAQPVAGLHLAQTLVAALAYLPPSEDLRRPDPLVLKVAHALRASGWELRPALRALLLAPEFRNATGTRRHVRSPVEAVVAMSKALAVPAHDAAWDGPLARMGQQLFTPPSVGGWPRGAEWLSPAAVIARYDAALVAVDLARAAPAVGRAPLPAAGDLAGWSRALALPALSASTSRSVQDYLASHAAGSAAERQAGVAALLLTCPEWTVV